MLLSITMLSRELSQPGMLIELMLYRIVASGAGTWTLGDGGTIEHLNDYILIEN